MEDIPQFIKDISEFDNVLHRGAIENEQKFYDILSTLDIQRVFDYFENLFFKRVWDFFKVSILFSKIVTFYRNRGYIFCTFYFDHRDIEDILIYQKVSPSLANLVSEEVLDVGHTTHRITIVKDKLVNITDHFFFEYIYDNHIKKNEEITLKDIRLYLSNRLLYDSSSSIYTDERMITRDSDDPFVYILFHDIESLHKYFSLHDILNPKYSRSHRVNDVVYHLSLISYSALNNFVEGFKFFLLSNVPITVETILMSVYSENLELIRICIQEDNDIILRYCDEIMSIVSSNRNIDLYNYVMNNSYFTCDKELRKHIDYTLSHNYDLVHCLTYENYEKELDDSNVKKIRKDIDYNIILSFSMYQSVNDFIFKNMFNEFSISETEKKKRRYDKIISFLDNIFTFNELGNKNRHEAIIESYSKLVFKNTKNKRCKRIIQSYYKFFDMYAYKID